MSSLSEIRKLARKGIVPLLDFIYPPVCLVCNASLEQGLDHTCATCWSSITSVDRDHPVWKEIAGKFAGEGLVSDFVTRFLFEKDGALQAIMHGLKYGGMKSVGFTLGARLGERILLDRTFSRADYLLPVPLHRRKRRERGYNQSEYIGKGISSAAGIPLAGSLLVRKQYTESQTQLNLRERRINVEGAFLPDRRCRSVVEGRTVLIVDDVITTGSTINACARVLLAAGAGRVLAASVAIAS